MTIGVELTYLGTATVVLQIGSTRLLTDPAFDPVGSTYDFGMWFTPRSWFDTEKVYETPVAPEALGNFDGVLVSHDHHADNLDLAGRKLIADEARVDRVITTVPGARRLERPKSERDAPGRGLGLGSRVHGLQAGATTLIGEVAITATPARHGPVYAPQVHQVIGFVIDVDDGPRIWISGDTVLYPALCKTLEELVRERPIDLAIVHCGAVAFPKALGFGHARFTFDAAEAIEACKILDPRIIVPVHRSGWAHFRQSESELAAAIEAADLGDRTRMLPLGDSLAL